MGGGGNSRAEPLHELFNRAISHSSPLVIDAVRQPDFQRSAILEVPKPPVCPSPDNGDKVSKEAEGVTTFTVKIVENRDTSSLRSTPGIGGSLADTGISPVESG